MIKFKICKTCKGRCCHKPSPPLSKEEVIIVETEIKRKLKTRKSGNIYYALGKGKCEFLTNKGCCLKYRPIACVLFPFYPTSKVWMVKTSCLYWDRMSQQDLEKAKNYFKINKKKWLGKLK